jgi:hypothetical protein
MVITPGKNEAAAGSSSGGLMSKIQSQGSLVQLRMKLLQWSYDQIVLMLHYSSQIFPYEFVISKHCLYSKVYDPILQ